MNKQIYTLLVGDAEIHTLEGGEETGLNLKTFCLRLIWRNKYLDSLKTQFLPVLLSYNSNYHL